MRNKFAIIFILISLGCLPAVFPDTTDFYKGVRAARSGKNDFAFMFFRSFLQSFPNSRLAEDAVFALGEYYFLTNNPSMAARYFDRFIAQYPKSKGRIFAYMYLLDLARRTENLRMTELYERDIVTSYNLSLIFRKYKQYTYESPFNKKYKALYYMDRVEMYINNELFSKIIY